MAGCADNMAQARWGCLDDLDDNLDTVGEYLQLRDQGVADLHSLEPKARRGLRKCLNVVTKEVCKMRTAVRSLEKEVSAIKTQVSSLEREKRSNLRSMVSGHVHRVGAPPEVTQAAAAASARLGCEELLAVCVLGAPAGAFNGLYASLQAQQPADSPLPPWECSAEDATRPEKDLLGMCPGGKPHLTEEQLEAKKASRCYCSYCVVCAKQQDREKALAAVKKKLLEQKPKLQAAEAQRHWTARAVSRLAAGGERAEDDADPVFYSEEQPFEAAGEASALAHRLAEAEWERVAGTLSLSDLPLRVVFLDKSGSMGHDTFCYEALQLGLHRSLHPTRGSTLTFLFAAPGQTEIIFRRPHDAPLKRNIELGSATWFNEPILRTLRFLAPAVEQLDFKGWMAEHGEPPLQVMCLTDGYDNCSPSNLSTLQGLVGELKEVVGPATGKKLYVPVTGPFKCPKEEAKVPVWMAWICCGMGGTSLLDANSCKEVRIVDAVCQPQFREVAEALPPPPDASSAASGEASEEEEAAEEETEEMRLQRSTTASRARQRLGSGRVSEAQLQQLANNGASSSRWSVGHRVRIKSSTPGQAPKAAVVVRVVEASEEDPVKYELLLDDESTAIVDDTQLLGAPAAPVSLLRSSQDGGAALPGGRPPSGRRSGGGRPGPRPQHGFLTRNAEPETQRLQLLAIVDTALQDLAGIMTTGNPKTGHVSLEDAVAGATGSEDIQGEVAEALTAMLAEAQEAMEVSTPPQTYTVNTSEVVLDALLATGRVAWKLLPEDRAVSQRLLCAGVELLLAGGNLRQAHLADQLGIFAGLMDAYACQRLKMDDGDYEAWTDMLARPLEDLLKSLSKHGLLEKSQTAHGEVLAAAGEARPCLMALRRLFDPCVARGGMEDALRRAVNRHQRLQPRFSFCSQTPNVDLSSEQGTGSTTADSSPPEGASLQEQVSASNAQSADSFGPAVQSPVSRTSNVKHGGLENRLVRSSSVTPLRSVGGRMSVSGLEPRARVASPSGTPHGMRGSSSSALGRTTSRSTRGLPVLGAVLSGSSAQRSREPASPVGSVGSPSATVVRRPRSSSLSGLPSIQNGHRSPSAVSAHLLDSPSFASNRTGLIGGASFSAGDSPKPKNSFQRGRTVET